MKRTHDHTEALTPRFFTVTMLREARQRNMDLEESLVRRKKIYAVWYAFIYARLESVGHISNQDTPAYVRLLGSELKAHLSDSVSDLDAELVKSVTHFDLHGFVTAFNAKYGEHGVAADVTGIHLPDCTCNGQRQTCWYEVLLSWKWGVADAANVVNPTPAPSAVLAPDAAISNTKVVRTSRATRTMPPAAMLSPGPVASPRNRTLAPDAAIIDAPIISKTKGCQSPEQAAMQSELNRVLGDPKTPAADRARADLIRMFVV